MTVRTGPAETETGPTGLLATAIASSLDPSHISISVKYLQTVPNIENYLFFTLC